MVRSWHRTKYNEQYGINLDEELEYCSNFWQKSSDCYCYNCCEWDYAKCHDQIISTFSSWTSGSDEEMENYIESKISTQHLEAYTNLVNINVISEELEKITLI
ncbi:hypothetical protein Glove_399g36 [Diversispora epigaea]|uniref:Uncharacterized protein n=1 Tax=Diversispora epigaea TaxID=1348612 RepID=A0A397H102_9GLOM|nr:hypothetical protein Glove_399g36 [Diversispora epigaea]